MFEGKGIMVEIQIHSSVHPFRHSSFPFPFQVRRINQDPKACLLGKEDFPLFHSRICLLRCIFFHSLPLPKTISAPSLGCCASFPFKVFGGRESQGTKNPSQERDLHHPCSRTIASFESVFSATHGSFSDFFGSPGRKSFSVSGDHWFFAVIGWISRPSFCRDSPLFAPPCKDLPLFSHPTTLLSSFFPHFDHSIISVAHFSGGWHRMMISHSSIHSFL